MSWAQAAVQEGSVQGEPRMTGTRKAIEIVRAIVGSIVKEGDIVVASVSKSKLWDRHEFETSNTKLEHDLC